MKCLTFCLLLALNVIAEPVPVGGFNKIVKKWAINLGDDLWKLSEGMIKSKDIKDGYKDMNASVKKKDGKLILKSSLSSVSTMLIRKIKAVKCIHATAQKLAAEFNYTAEDYNDFQYCSAKYSKFKYEDPNDVIEESDENIPKFAKNSTNYMEVNLERDTHFYDINVNTNLSCVHVPTNIYYKEKEALNAILWSKGLNDIFIKNYKSDPSLAWQYFGSSRGILRFYPGMPWNNRKVVDTYDCRVRSWYIEAATCSKDVIILFDVSGSMTGFKNYVARRTLSSLLDTLSNNDYVNVYTFKNETAEVVKCFVGLVQATPENLKTIKDTLEPTDNGKNHKVPLEGYANLTEAYIKAFTTLKARRTNCSVSSTQGCNQLVMVITDYVPGNLTEVFEEYNRETVDNVTYTPVRVFTFLIGKEVTNVREIQWMACLNRGYFVHIHSVEEVQQQVLKYINVIARPMILAAEDEEEPDEPPPTWTHANIDYTRTHRWDVSSDVKKPDEDKLVTSVAIPAFDLKYNKEHNDAMLLGVAGTDVPIDSIAKLAQPHQLGVNGYSFIVSNNGYLLLHPLLITTINNELQSNYNSVDFVEVEQVDDGNGPRVLGEEIQTLRQKLVQAEHGNMSNIKVLFHYDNMRRIARVKHDYFFNKLEGTPFSMGISLPCGYGDTELHLGKDNPKEATQSMQFINITNVTDYFRVNFRVHPDWVYCKYHYLEGHESDNAEEEIFSFLVRISKGGFNISKIQYVEEEDKRPFHLDTHCGDATTQLQKDDYYCNTDLVKQLIFDAKLTTPFFKEWKPTDAERDLTAEFNVSVRFIATSSGLTRWHYIYDEDMNEMVDDHGNRIRNSTKEVFGERYFNAIEETWYKAAVLQHVINPDSLVVATPLPILDEIIENKPEIIKDGDITMTASRAIFYKDGEFETPASVFGFEFSFLSFQKRFFNITDTASETPDFKCKGTNYNCYLVDSSGYIVMSSDIEKIGKFFGVVEGFVLSSFLEKKVFDHVEVFNYQALCKYDKLRNQTNRAWSLMTPFHIATHFFRWLFAELFILISNAYNWDMTAYAIPSYEEDYDQISLMTESPITTTIPPPVKNETTASKDEDKKPFSCDHRISLYILNQSMFLNNTEEVYESVPGDCHPAYWAAYVRKTNLLLVVVEVPLREFKANCTIPPDTEPKPTDNSTTSGEPCHKLDLAGLTRRRLEGCYTYHEGEKNITACGIGSLASVDLFIFIACTVAALLVTHLRS